MPLTNRAVLHCLELRIIGSSEGAREFHEDGGGKEDRDVYQKSTHVDMSTYYDSTLTAKMMAAHISVIFLYIGNI